MTDRNFLQLLHARRLDGMRVCVGLDPDIDKMKWRGGETSMQVAERQLTLCRQVVDETKYIALAFKPNIAFFARTGAWDQLGVLISYIKRVAPHIPVILDFKRGDIGNTNKGYFGEAFDIYQADAITVHPYLGYEAMAPFLADPDKFAFVLCKTSNSGGGEFQDLNVILETDERDTAFRGRFSVSLYEYVAYRVANFWNRNGNVGLVVGATYPDELADVRQIVGPDIEILVPGVGTQGGDAEATVAAGGDHILVNASSSLMFAENIGHAAYDLHNLLHAADAANA